MENVAKGSEYALGVAVDATDSRGDTGRWPERVETRPITYADSISARTG